MKFNTFLTLTLSALLLTACSSSSRPPPPAPPPPPPPVTVTSVDVMAQTGEFVTTSEVAKGAVVQFKANANMSDSTANDVTLTAGWVSSDATILAFETPTVPGVATAKKEGGPVTITATETSGTAGTLSYTVAAPAPTGLAIDPVQVPNGVPVGQEGNFKATYTLTDKSTSDATMDVDWSSSAGGIVVVGNDAGNKGKAIALSAGESNISASKGTLRSQDVEVSVFVPVAGPEFVVEPSSPDQLPLGRTQQFRALLKYPTDNKVVDVTDRVTWQTSAANLANFPVDFPKGLLLASTTTAGPVMITAQDPATSALTSAVTITVSNVAIQSVVITPVATASNALPVGTNRQLGVVAAYADSIARDITQTVEWTTAGLGHLAVTNSFGSKGRVTAIQEPPLGQPNDAVVITDPVSSQSVNVEIDTSGRTLERIEIGPADNQELPLGHTVNFQATAIFTDKTSDPVTELVTWETSAGDRVAISNTEGEKGKATALKPGDSAINAAYVIAGDKKLSNFVLVKATPVVVLESVEIKPTGAASLALGRTQRLTADGIFSDGTRRDISGLVNWRSGSPAIVSVGNSGRQKGTVTGLAVGGPISITATEPRTGTFASKAVSVTGKTLDAIVIDPPGITSSPQGVPFKYTADASFSDGSGIPITEDVQWISSNPDTANISNETGSKGIIYPRTVGDVTVTASGEGVTSVPVTFRVLPATLASIAITPSTPQNINVDDIVNFTAQGTYSDGVPRNITKTVFWESDNRSTALITNNEPNEGILVGRGPGLATITAIKDSVTSNATEVMVAPQANIRTVQEVASGCCLAQQVTMLGGATEFDGDENYTFEDSTGTIQLEWEGSPPITLGPDIVVTGVAESSEVNVSNWSLQ